MLVQHGATTDYIDAANNNGSVNGSRSRSASKAAKSGYHKKMSTSSHNTLMSKSSTGSSDTEPFYLHPPSVRQSQDNIYNQSRRLSSSTPPEIYGVATDGLYINPMRGGVSPNGSVSGESFYLHDPQEVIYNRVKDLFDSDSGGSSHKDTVSSSSGGAPAGPMPPNALTVQVEVHSSSSGAGSGSEESLSVSSTSDDAMKRPSSRSQIASSPASANSSALIEQHDYEDIYLVREEAHIASKPKYAGGRSRSRDSGSHSRSASASSNHSADIIVHYGANVSLNRRKFVRKIFSIENAFQNSMNRDSLLNKRNKSNDGKAGKFDPPMKTNESKPTSGSPSNQMKNDTYESVCSPEDVAERMKVAQKHALSAALSESSSNLSTVSSRGAKRVDSKGENDHTAAGNVKR